jgi:hypothetical protein
VVVQGFALDVVLAVVLRLALVLVIIGVAVLLVLDDKSVLVLDAPVASAVVVCPAADVSVEVVGDEDENDVVESTADIVVGTVEELLVL